MRAPDSTIRQKVQSRGDNRKVTWAVLRACAGCIEFLPSFAGTAPESFSGRMIEWGFWNSHASPPSFLFPFPRVFIRRPGSCPVGLFWRAILGTWVDATIALGITSSRRFTPGWSPWPAQPCCKCRSMVLTRNRLWALRVLAASLCHALAFWQAVCFTDHASPALRCEHELGYTHPAKQCREAVA